MRPSDVDILALTSDAQLLQVLQEAAHGAHGVHCATTAAEANNLAVEHLVGIFVTDVPLHQLAATIAPLQLRAPGLVTILVGDRDHGSELLEANNSGSVFRFLLKPFPTGQLRLYIDAAVKHHIEVIARGPQPLPAPRSEAVASPAPRADRRLLIAGALGVSVAVAAWMLAAPPDDAARTTTPVAAAPNAGTMEVLNLLAQARRAEREGHLVEPPDHSALDLYQQVLALEPSKVEASQGLAVIADQMFAQADAALAAGQLDEARADVAHARRALPGHPRLAYFATRLEVEEQRAKISQALEAAGTGAMNKAAGLIDEAAQVRLGESGAVTEARAELARREQAESQVQKVLGLAQTRTAEGQLVEPAEDNALYYLEAARRSGARQTAVAPVAAALSSALLAEASAATHRGELDAAKQWLARASEVDPTADGLAGAEIELAAASGRAEEQTRWYTLALERLDHGDLIEPVDDSAAYYLAKLHTEAPDYPGLGDALDRLADASLMAARSAVSARQLPEARQHIDAVKTLGLRSADVEALDSLYAAAEKRTAAPAAASTPTYAKLVRRKYVAPDYPPPAERRQIEGRVELALTVDPSGKVSNVEVKSAKPRDTFEKAAIAAAQKWEFQPAEVDGRPVEARTLVAIDFNLE